MHMQKRITTLLAFTTTLCLANSCTTPKKAAVSTETRVPAKFDFSPSEKAPVGSTGITIALIKPRFVKDNPINYVEPINEMATSMANDFNELLSAKGFKIRGPFQSIGEMTYSEQQGTDFCMNIEIDLHPQSTDKWTYSPGWGAIVPPSYKMSGAIAFSGSFNIVATSAKGVKLWVKSIPLDNASYNYVGSMKWQNVPTLAQQIRQDNEVYNIVARQLEKYYSNALNLAWQQIDSQEMKEVAKQSKEADKR